MRADAERQVLALFAVDVENLAVRRNWRLSRTAEPISIIIEAPSGTVWP